MYPKTRDEEAKKEFEMLLEMMEVLNVNKLAHCKLRGEEDEVREILETLKELNFDNELALQLLERLETLLF